MAGNDAPFVCDFPGCGLAYRHKYHLTRHAKRHSQVQSFECPFCDRTFSRNDALRQHSRTQHRNRDLQLSRTARACTFCRSRRSKCDGQTPCQACSQREMFCSYGESVRGQERRARTEPEHPPSPLLSGEPDHLNPSHFLPMDLSPMPGLESIEGMPQIQPCIEAYFEKFHPNWPFINPTTFNADKKPPFLVHSVVMMGLWVMQDSTSQGLAKDLHQRLTTSILEQRDKWDISDQDESEMQLQEILAPEGGPWPLETYQGILIQLIFSLLTSDILNLQLQHVLPEMPSRLLFSLARTCLKRDMFYYPSIHDQYLSESEQGVCSPFRIQEVKQFNLALYKVCQHAQVNDPGILLEDESGFRPRGGLKSPDECLLSLRDLQFSLPGIFNLDQVSNGENSEDCEDRWISQAGAFASHQGGFQWI
ncbi:uncharacterized protein N7483_011373 [Penicillium malachiteum]|uniref:uncharacterized protein n=1 Tax=Penicillium malachiteum TaxID=1324776 RepID=UPI0025495A67|nr:uncharacterized protein N7483_011373 [Penicillium malachiteum]KAJ5714192.1 hypothetical protein N7483_011373 [Penicillium malachiteum]